MLIYISSRENIFKPRRLTPELRIRQRDYYHSETATHPLATGNFLDAVTTTTEQHTYAVSSGTRLQHMFGQGLA